MNFEIGDLVRMMNGDVAVVKSIPGQGERIVTHPICGDLLLGIGVLAEFMTPEQEVKQLRHVVTELAAVAKRALDNPWVEYSEQWDNLRQECQDACDDAKLLIQRWGPTA